MKKHLPMLKSIGATMGLFLTIKFIADYYVATGIADANFGNGYFEATMTVLITCSVILFFRGVVFTGDK